MTINILRGRSVTKAPPEALPIGEIGRTIFGCPDCARPLATGTRRCPGCGTLLAFEVPLRRASVFVALGLFVGVILGVGAAVVARPAASSGDSGRDGPASVPISSPSPSPVFPTTRPSPTAAPTGVPAAALAALAQSATMDGRLLAAAPELRKALAAKAFDPSAVARVLRTLASNAATAAQMAPRLGTWQRGAALAADLEAAYGDLRDVALRTLQASLNDAATYRAGATHTLDLLARLADLHTDVAALAVEVGLVLPPP